MRRSSLEPRRKSSGSGASRVARILLVPLWILAQAARADPAPPPAFATVEADRENIYQNETFTLTFTIFYRGFDVDFGGQIRGLPDASVLKLGTPQEFATPPATVDGQAYSVRRFRAPAVCPQPCDIRLEPVIPADAVVVQQIHIFRSERRQPLELRARPLALRILPLPDAGRPADFAGAVGQFSLDVQVVPTNAAAGDLINVDATISGAGSWEKVTPPRVTAGDAFRIYAPVVASEALGAGSGRRTYRVVVVPKDTTAREIGPVRFVYFDPRAGAYRALERGPFALSIHSPTAESTRPPLPPAEPGAGGASRSRAELGPLKAPPAVWRRTAARPWFEKPAPLAALALPLPALLMLAALRRRATRTPADARPPAGQVIGDRLAQAEEAARGNNARAFHEHLWAALTLCCTERLGIPPDRVSRAEIVARCAGRVSPETAGRLADAVDACERAKYGAPADVFTAETAALADAVRQTLREIEEAGR